MLATRGAVARHAGVDFKTVVRWLDRGLLPGEGPWPPEVVDQAHAEWDATRRPRAAVAECGTDSGYRAGCHCDACSAAHVARSKVDKRRIRAAFWADRVDDLCAALASGLTYREALDEVGVSAQAVTGWRHVDPVFAARVDAALMRGRDPDLDHGAPSAWKQRCRCPECREYHVRASNRAS